MNDETLNESPVAETEEEKDVITCDRCGDEIGEDDETHSIRTGNNDWEEWCDDCRCNHSRSLPEGDGDCSEGYYDRHCFFCEVCEEDYYGYSGSHGLCSGCEERESESDDDSLLKDYSDKAEDEHGFFGAQGQKWRSFYDATGFEIHKPTLFFGMELEVECTGSYGDFENAVNSVKDLLDGFAICKHDGSLSSKGFEIVTAPATMPEFKKRTEKFFAEFPAVCKRYDLKSWDTTTCGLHVHVSKDALSRLQIGKIQSVVTDEASRAMIKAIAGRTSSYAKYDCKKKIAHYNPERYEAVNTTPRNTIEFRLFRGNTKREGIMRSIEFCLALVEFSAPGGGMSLKHADGRSEFTKWLSLPAQAKVYPNLVHFLAVRKFVKRHHRKHGLVKGKA